MKSKFTIYILLVAALIVFAKIFWQNDDSYQSYQSRGILKTEGSNTPKADVPQEASVPPTISATPADILLPPAPLPNGLMISIAIQNNNTTTNLLRLSEPKVNVPGVGVEIRELQPGKFFMAQLGFPQGFAAPPGQQVEFRVKTSDPNVPVIRVPVKQMSRAPSIVPPQTATMPARPPGKASSAADNLASPRPGARWKELLPDLMHLGCNVQASGCRRRSA